MLERKGGERGGAGGGERMQDIEGYQPARSTRQADKRNKRRGWGALFGSHATTVDQKKGSNSSKRSSTASDDPHKCACAGCLAVREPYLVDQGIVELQSVEDKW